LGGLFFEAKNHHKHWPKPHFKGISTRMKSKSPRNTPLQAEFQQVPRDRDDAQLAYVMLTKDK
jgi:hypothetical protein